MSATNSQLPNQAIPYANSASANETLANNALSNSKNISVTFEPELAGNTNSSLIASENHACNFAYTEVKKIDRDHFWYVVRNERILNAVKRYVPNWQEASFLEIGSGSANVVGYLHDHGVKNATGYEINPVGLRVSRERYPSIRFVERNLFDTDGPNESFDTVGMFDCLEHFEDDVHTLKRVRQLMNDNGKLIIAVPAFEALWSGMDDIFGHYRRYTKASLMKALLSAGFSGAKLTYFYAPLYPVLLLRRKFIWKFPENLSDAQIQELLAKDVVMPPKPINELLKFVLRAEEKILGMSDMNFGASLLAVVSK